jgi:four helix bundle protein
MSESFKSNCAGESAWERDEECVMRETAQPLGYRDLKVWQIGRELSIEIHRLTLEKLPKFELYEEGSQIRRSVKSIRSNIVEGFGRRRYKQDFIKHLVYAEAFCDETIDHLDTLFETGSLTDRTAYESLRPRLCELARPLNRFVAAVETQHESPK